MLAKIDTLGELREFLNSTDLPDYVPIIFSDKNNDIMYDINFGYTCYIDNGYSQYFGIEDLAAYMQENAVTKEEANDIQLGIVIGYLESTKLDNWIKEVDNG